MLKEVVKRNSRCYYIVPQALINHELHPVDNHTLLLILKYTQRSVAVEASIDSETSNITRIINNPAPAILFLRW
jgi:hypothetical protein